MTTPEKTPYWLNEDERPGEDDQMLYADFRGKEAGVPDRYGFSIARVAHASNAQYDRAWLEMEGRVTLPQDFAEATHVDRSVVGVVQTKGNITGNYSKADLVRLRNAIDMVIEGMEYEPGTEPKTVRLCRNCKGEIPELGGHNFRSAASPDLDLDLWYCDADCADGHK